MNKSPEASLDALNSHINMPRTCELRLKGLFDSLGFDVVNDERNIGVYIDRITDNSLPAKASLRSGDRIIEINGEFIDDKPSHTVRIKLREATYARIIKLYVMDRNTYNYFKEKNLPLRSSEFDESEFQQKLLQKSNVNDQHNDDTQRDTDDDDRSIKITSTKSTSKRVSHEIQLKPTSDASEFGFIIRTDQNSEFKHKVSSIDANSPAEKGGLNVGDFVLRVNGESIENMTRSQMIHCVALAVRDSLKNNKILVLEILREDSNQLPNKNDRNTITEPEKPITKLKTREYKIMRDSDTQSYGFQVTLDSDATTKYRIRRLAPNSPAAKQGLKIGDYIVSINGTNVEQMSQNQVFECLYSKPDEKNSNNELLVLEVLNDNLQNQPDVSPSTPDCDEKYPEIRDCLIQNWPHYSNLGFRIFKSINKSNPHVGYRIGQVDKNSPAANTNIRDGDYIIELNGRNVEADDYLDLKHRIKKLYRKEHQISLLVIDDQGYHWYKTRQIPIQSSSKFSNIVRFVTPSYVEISSSNGRRTLSSTSAYDRADRNRTMSQSYLGIFEALNIRRKSWLGKTSRSGSAYETRSGDSDSILLDSNDGTMDTQSIC